MMTSRPGLAKTILADVVPRKNFPIKVPWLFHTYLQSFSNEFSGSGWRDADLYSVSTSWVHISIKINLNTVSNACIDIGKSSAIFKHICLRIDIESVPGNYTALRMSYHAKTQENLQRCRCSLIMPKITPRCTCICSIRVQINWSELSVAGHSYIHISSHAVSTKCNAIWFVKIGGHDADSACLWVEAIDLTWQLRTGAVAAQITISATLHQPKSPSRWRSYISTQYLWRRFVHWDVLWGHSTNWTGDHSSCPSRW